MFAALQLTFAALAAFALVFVTPTIALVIRKDASPVTLPFARRFNTTGAAKLLELDRARAKALRTGMKASPNVSQQGAAVNAPATNQAVDYVTTVHIGNPGKNYTLLIDTGSSNTWVGARPLENPFVPSLTTDLSLNVVSVQYGSGFVTGVEMTDSITLGSGLTIEKQSMGAALLSGGFTDVDGILGIGPQDLTCGTLLLGSQCIPTVTDNAFSQGLIPEHLVAISFEPTTTLDNTNGELTFGGIDNSKFTGPLHFVPITSTSPSSQFVGIDQSITFGTPLGSTVLPMTAGVTDTGTTLLLIASADAFAKYQSLTGGVLDATTGLLRITPEQFANLKSLFFNIGGASFEFTPNAQIWPRALNSAIGGASDAIYLVINDLGINTGSGMDFIDGMTFLERFYYVFDVGNSRVGLATTPFTFATTN
ncbi:family A1 protease [Pilatotrama ljubarskyi]|nr:family A1 protease [Pilatotrama ljubarskyi]